MSPVLGSLRATSLPALVLATLVGLAGCPRSEPIPRRDASAVSAPGKVPASEKVSAPGKVPASGKVSASGKGSAPGKVPASEKVSAPGKVPASNSCSTRAWQAEAGRREQAVARGLRWLERYISAREGCLPALKAARPGGKGCTTNSVLAVLHSDAVSPFLEVAVGTASPTMRRLAMGVARRMAHRVAPLLLGPGVLDDRDALFEAIWLLAEGKDLQLRSPRLWDQVLRRLRAMPTADVLYDTQIGALARASEDDVYALLVDAYVLEKLRLRRPREARVSFGLEKVLAFLQTRPYVSHAADRSDEREIFWDQIYLATHVGFVLTDYGRLRLRPRDMPRSLAFLEAHTAVALGHDLDLAAEIVDLLRSAGKDGGQNHFICVATRRLLKAQNSDGSWGDWRKADDHYDAIHPTWTAIHSLRERQFVGKGPYSRQIRRILTRLRERPGRL